MNTCPTLALSLRLFSCVMTFKLSIGRSIYLAEWKLHWSLEHMVLCLLQVWPRWVSWSSDPQPFWPQVLFLWMTVFPRTEVGDGLRIIHVHNTHELHLLCTLFLLLLHQLHLRSSGIRSRKLGTPDSEETLRGPV